MAFLCGVFGRDDCEEALERCLGKDASVPRWAYLSRDDSLADHFQGQEVSVFVRCIDQRDIDRVVGQSLDQGELHGHHQIVADHIAGCVQCGRGDGVGRHDRGVDEDLDAVGAVVWIRIYKELVTWTPGE